MDVSDTRKGSDQGNPRDAREDRRERGPGDDELVEEHVTVANKKRYDCFGAKRGL